MTLRLASPAFRPGQEIPRRHTCDGDDISPALRWEDPPPGTRTYALIMDDPDAPGSTWVHWVAFDLPTDSQTLAEHVPASATLKAGGRHGKNSWGRSDYGGPCPPSGRHRYFFRLYALDAELGLPTGADAGEVRKAMEGHVLATAELMGTYSR
jgi:Raf kinase inhibitor-like YbhB/YbcL family protein